MISIRCYCMMSYCFRSCYSSICSPRSDWYILGVLDLERYFSTDPGIVSGGCCQWCHYARFFPLIFGMIFVFVFKHVVYWLFFSCRLYPVAFWLLVFFSTAAVFRSGFPQALSFRSGPCLSFGFVSVVLSVFSRCLLAWLSFFHFFPGPGGMAATWRPGRGISDGLLGSV